MKARMIHRTDGSTYEIPYDARTNQVCGLLLNDFFTSVFETGYIVGLCSCLSFALTLVS